jgi:hypothetical protein
MALCLSAVRARACVCGQHEVGVCKETPKFLPQVVDMCVYVLAPPVDTASVDIVASFCTYPGNTLLLYIPPSAHFLVEVEN